MPVSPQLSPDKVVSATATNAVATATAAAAGAGLSLRTIHVVAGWSAAPTGNPLLTLNQGVTTVATIPCPTAGLNIPIPMLGHLNEDVSVSLAAGGAAIVGYVTLFYQSEG